MKLAPRVIWILCLAAMFAFSLSGCDQRTERTRGSGGGQAEYENIEEFVVSEELVVSVKVGNAIDATKEQQLLQAGDPVEVTITDVENGRTETVDAVIFGTAWGDVAANGGTPSPLILTLKVNGEDKTRVLNAQKDGKRFSAKLVR